MRRRPSQCRSGHEAAAFRAATFEIWATKRQLQSRPRRLGRLKPRQPAVVAPEGASDDRIGQHALSASLRQQSFIFVDRLPVVIPKPCRTHCRSSPSVNPWRTNQFLHEARASIESLMRRKDTTPSLWAKSPDRASRGGYIWIDVFPFQTKTGKAFAHPLQGARRPMPRTGGLNMI